MSLSLVEIFNAESPIRFNTCKRNILILPKEKNGTSIAAHSVFSDYTKEYSLLFDELASAASTIAHVDLIEVNTF